MAVGRIRHASQVTVRAQTAVCAFHLSIYDDGVGEADPLRGSGLIGLGDMGRLRPCMEVSWK